MSTTKLLTLSVLVSSLSSAFGLRLPTPMSTVTGPAEALPTGFRFGHGPECEPGMSCFEHHHLNTTTPGAASATSHPTSMTTELSLIYPIPPSLSTASTGQNSLLTTITTLTTLTSPPKGVQIAAPIVVATNPPVQTNGPLRPTWRPLNVHGDPDANCTVSAKEERSANVGRIVFQSNTAGCGHPAVETTEITGYSRCADIGFGIGMYNFWTTESSWEYDTCFIYQTAGCPGGNLPTVPIIQYWPNEYAGVCQSYGPDQWGASIMCF